MSTASLFSTNCRTADDDLSEARDDHHHLFGGTIGLFAPIGVVKWLFRIDPEDAGILTLFFFPVWCLLVVPGLLIGRRLGLLMTGEKRVTQR